MTGFSSLNTALSAMRYNRIGMDVAAQNLANVGTAGYARRVVNASEVGGATQPAMWSRNSSVGDGVKVSSVDRMTNALLDVRARLEHGNQSYLDTRSAVMDRVETGIGEPGPNGVAAAMADFRAGWGDLANNPNGDAARSQLLARANTLAAAINGQARNITTEMSDQRHTLNAQVAEVNTVAGDLAATNKSIAAATVSGADAGSLLDQRDQLALRLSELTGATAKIGDNGVMNVTLGGVSLVDGSKANELKITKGVTDTGESDGNSTVELTVMDNDADPANPPITPVAGKVGNGEIGATTELLNTTLPGYLTKLNGVVATLVDGPNGTDGVNAQHEAGFDAAGISGGKFFSYDPTDPAGTLVVAVTDPAKIAASGQPGGVVDGSNAALLGKPYKAESAYQTLVNGFGTAVASASRLAANQTVLTGQIDNSRDQLSGVSIDEEMANMMSLQHSYEAAARVMTTVDSMLDTLINRTGLTH